MRRALHLHPGGWREGPRGLERRAVLVGRDGGRQEIAVALPAERADLVGDSADAFVLLALFAAMRRARRLRVHGTVSPSLLANLERFVRAWQRWRPRRYRAVGITADAVAEDEPAGDAGGTGRAVLTLSGGLDSSFSAWRHTRGPLRDASPRLATTVTVHGFDIPLANEGAFARAAHGARRIATALGLDWIPVRCSVRALADDWEDSHGAALAACLHLVRGGHAAGMIAASHARSTLRFPWGSNPRTDPLLGTSGFAIVYDGIDATRPEKARALAGSAEVLENLRVCWEGPAKEGNCGHCLRCIGTALCFAAEGLAVPPVLGVASLEDGVQRLPGSLPSAARLRLHELVALARARRDRAAWVDALAARLAGGGAGEEEIAAAALRAGRDG